MKTKEREVYLAPQCQIVQMSETTCLMETSFPSQHKKANHGTGPTASAKAENSWEDEAFEETNNDDSSSLWGTKFRKL